MRVRSRHGRAVRKRGGRRRLLTWRARPLWSDLARAEAAITGADETAGLLERCAGKDLAAFRTLYDAQSGRLYGLALRITRDPELAADAVQDAFLLIWRRAERFDATRGSAGAWLAALVRYRAIDLQRRRGREHVSDVLAEGADSGPDALDQLVRTAEGAALQACLAALPPERRTLLMRAFVGGRSYAALALEDGEKLGTVKARIRRALASLKQCLQP